MITLVLGSLASPGVEAEKRKELVHIDLLLMLRSG
jgi:hypothetical protein